MRRSFFFVQNYLKAETEGIAPFVLYALFYT